MTHYLRNHTSFCLISEANEKLRKELEFGLIALLAQDSKFVPTSNWLGLWMPDSRIQESGLWNIQGLSGIPLSSDELSKLSNQFIL